MTPHTFNGLSSESLAAQHVKVLGAEINPPNLCSTNVPWLCLCLASSLDQRPEQRAVLRLRAVAGTAAAVTPALARARTAGARASGAPSYVERHMRYRGSPKPAAGTTAAARSRRAAAMKVCCTERTMHIITTYHSISLQLLPGAGIRARSTESRLHVSLDL